MLFRSTPKLTFCTTVVRCLQCVCVSVSCLVVSDSLQAHRLQPTRPLHPWDSPGKNTGVGCHSFSKRNYRKKESEVIQSCRTLCDAIDCSPPGSSIYGIFQARVLEWVAISFSAASVVSGSPRQHFYRCLSTHLILSL